MDKLRLCSIAFMAPWQQREEHYLRESSEGEGKSGGKKGFSYFGWKQERKRNDLKGIEGTRDREAEMVEKNYGTNLSWRCFLLLLLLLLEGRMASTCGNNHPANDS